MQIPHTWPGLLALTVLVTAMLGGAVTALMLLTDRNPPMNLGILHGRAGVAGILILLLVVVLGNDSHPSLAPALGLYMLTAVGGLTLYFLIRRKGTVPKLVVFGHGALAVAALAMLLFGLPR